MCGIYRTAPSDLSLQALAAVAEVPGTAAAAVVVLLAAMLPAVSDPPLRPATVCKQFVALPRTQHKYRLA